MWDVHTILMNWVWKSQQKHNYIILEVGRHVYDTFLTCVSTDYIPMSPRPKLCICTTAASTVSVNVSVCSCTKSTLTSASASASRALWSPKLACRVVLGEDRCAWLSTKAFLSGWLMQLALPKVVSRRFSGLSAGPLLTATLCGLQGLGMSLGCWSVARLGLWLSVLFLWRGTAAPSDRTLTLIISFVLCQFGSQHTGMNCKDWIYF